MTLTVTDGNSPLADLLASYTEGISDSELVFPSSSCERDAWEFEADAFGYDGPPIDRIIVTTWRFADGTLGSGWDLSYEARGDAWQLSATAEEIGFGCTEQLEVGLIYFVVSDGALGHPSGGGVRGSATGGGVTNDTSFEFYADDDTESATLLLFNPFTGASSGALPMRQLGGGGDGTTWAAEADTSAYGSDGNVVAGMAGYDGEGLAIASYTR